MTRGTIYVSSDGQRERETERQTEREKRVLDKEIPYVPDYDCLSYRSHGLLLSALHSLYRGLQDGGVLLYAVLCPRGYGCHEDKN